MAFFDIDGIERTDCIERVSITSRCLELIFDDEGYFQEAENWFDTFELSYESSEEEDFGEKRFVLRHYWR